MTDKEKKIIEIFKQHEGIVHDGEIGDDNIGILDSQYEQVAQEILAMTDNLSPQMKDKREQLHDLIYEFLLHFNCMYTVELGTDDGYPLVDLLSPDSTIKEGKAEIQHISEELGDEIYKTLTVEYEGIVIKNSAFETFDGTEDKWAGWKPTGENKGKLLSLDEVFSDLPPRTNWQILRMAFIVWWINQVVSPIKNLIAPPQED